MSKYLHRGAGIPIGIILLWGLLPLQPELKQASAQVISDRKTEANRLLNEGLRYLEIYQAAEAIQAFQQAWQIYQQIGDRPNASGALNNLGIAHRRLGQYQKAIGFYQQALTIKKEIGDLKGMGNSFLGLGLAYDSLGQYQKAIDFHLQSLAIYQQIGDRLGEGDTLNNLGNVYDSLGQYQKAIASYQKSLALKKEIGDRSGIGSSLGNLGNIYYSLGQYQKAIDFHLQSMTISQELGNRKGEGSSLNNLGNAYYSLGNYQVAIASYKESLIIFRQIAARNDEGYALNNLGNCYESLGQYLIAGDYYKQALAIKKETGDLSGQGNSLANLGSVYKSLGGYPQAIKFHQQALAIFRQIGDRSGIGKSLGNLGNTYDSLKQYQKAIDFHLASLAIKKEIGDRDGEGNSLGNLGNAYNSLGQFQKAIQFQQQSLAIKTEIGDRDGQRNTLNNLGVILANLNQTDLAILAYKQSVNITESMRRDISELSKEEQRSYLETIQGGYRSLADLLLQKGRITEALQILDLLKIQELEDYFKSSKKDLNPNLADNQAIKLLSPELKLRDRLVTANTTELNRQLATQIAQLPPSEINQVPTYLQKIPKHTALLYPLILSDRLELILFSAHNPPINQSVSIRGSEFEELVKDFRSDLQNPLSQDAKISGKKVYDLMIKPLAAQLKQANISTILYAPDGILRYIPLAALYDGKQWLVEQYQINNLIAYSLFDSDRQSQPKISNLPILTGAFGGKDGETRFGNLGLGGSIPEVENISKNFSNVTSLVERNFSAKATKERASKSSIIHLATHAEFNTGSPLDSYILFGDGSRVTLAEISEWQLQSTDLVVLSACETGIGTFGTGEEVLGFGYQVQRAGAKASIASLWTVSDSGTQLLMSSFYQNLQSQNVLMSLRNSQIAMIKKPIKIDEVNFNHPYFWASFVVIGNSL